MLGPMRRYRPGDIMRHAVALCDARARHTADKSLLG